jgi:serine/threonine protein phosphatase PrpC
LDVVEIIVTEAERAQRDGIVLAGGRVSVFSSRSPARTTPNEDAVAIFGTGTGSGVLVLADGAGGLPAGAQASQVAVEEIRRGLDGVNGQENGLRYAILNAIESANEAILEMRAGAATTLEVVEILDGSLRSYHIGDSRTYLVGGRGKLKFHTVSHSPVGYAVASGLVDEKDALFHDDLHVVSNLLGCQDMKIEIGPVLRLSPRDTVLVASDGLTDNVHEDEIVEHIRKGSLARACESLAGLAEERMLAPALDEPSKADDLSFVLFRPQ